MINPTRIKQIQDKIKSALNQIEKDENIKIEFKALDSNIVSYSSIMYVTSLDDSEKVMGVLERLCKKVGFTQNIIGLKFKSTRSGEITITDIKLTNRKYPIIGKSIDGTSYKFTTEQIKKYLGGDKLINRGANLDKLLGKK